MLTREELIQTIWEVENIKIALEPINLDDNKIAVFNDYLHTERLSGDYTVNDFERIRLNPILRTVRYISKEEFRILRDN